MLGDLAVVLRNNAAWAPAQNTSFPASMIIVISHQNPLRKFAIFNVPFLFDTKLTGKRKMLSSLNNEIAKCSRVSQQHFFSSLPFFFFP